MTNLHRIVVDQLLERAQRCSLTGDGHSDLLAQYRSPSGPLFSLDEDPGHWGRDPMGAEVVRRLESRGVTVASASRRAGVDLATGEGLEATLKGVDCVVHAATNRLRHRTVDLYGTRRMITILANHPTPPHVIYVSIVGCDRIPQRYYHTKYECELDLQRSGLPVTVIRATQFHTLITEIAQAAMWGPLEVSRNV